MKDELLDRTITVSDKKEFQGAVSAGYGIIYVTGGLKGDILDEYQKRRKGNTLSTVAIIAGVFFMWPFLVAGITGKVFLHDIKNYELKEDTNNMIAFYHKNQRVV